MIIHSARKEEDLGGGVSKTLYTKIFPSINMIVIARSLRRRRSDIRYEGESSLEVGETTVIWISYVGQL